MDDRLLEELRHALPRLVRERPEIAAEIQIRLRDAFASKDDLRAVIEAFDRRTEAHHSETLARFEAMQAELDRRFEAVDRRFEAMQAALQNTNQLLGDLKSWVQSNVGGLQRRAGRRLEETIAGTLRFALGVRDLRADQLRLRQKVRDERGIIGPKGREYECDIVAVDGEAIVFEIKSVAETEDVERFADKARLVEESLGRPALRKVLVTLDKPPEIVDACERLGIVLV
jgi:hypothetical protein